METGGWRAIAAAVRTVGDSKNQRQHASPTTSRPRAAQPPRPAQHAHARGFTAAPRPHAPIAPAAARQHIGEKIAQCLALAAVGSQCAMLPPTTLPGQFDPAPAPPELAVAMDCNRCVTGTSSSLHLKPFQLHHSGWPCISARAVTCGKGATSRGPSGCRASRPTRRTQDLRKSQQHAACSTASASASGAQFDAPCSPP